MSSDVKFDDFIKKLKKRYKFLYFDDIYEHLCMDIDELAKEFKGSDKKHGNYKRVGKVIKHGIVDYILNGSDNKDSANDIIEDCPKCGNTLPTELKSRMNHLISCKLSHNHKPGSNKLEEDGSSNQQGCIPTGDCCHNKKGNAVQATYTSHNQKAKECKAWHFDDFRPKGKRIVECGNDWLCLDCKKKEVVGG